MPGDRAMGSEGGILVTGGAGYIGGHVVSRLIGAGERVIVLDDLRNARRDAVGGAAFHRGDIGSDAWLDTVFRRRIATIVHLAASTTVSESVVNPGKYYRNNAAATARLLRYAVANRVRHFIFASTAAVYGRPQHGICREDAPTVPINPYGESKLMAERMVRDACAPSRMRHVIFRYFNVAGARPDAPPAPRGRASTPLVKAACEVATGARGKIEIFGTDYATADGTCIRDYVHVEDLAAAHVAALRYLRAGGASTTLNCGIGKGYSVREVIRAVARAAARPLPVRETARRPGDPPAVVAAPDRIARVLDWSPEFDDLDRIARSALARERALSRSGLAGRAWSASARLSGADSADDRSADGPSGRADRG